MGNSASRKRRAWAEGGSSTDVEPRTRDFSPWRKGRSEPPASSLGILDVPSKPGKAVVTLTNLQSDKPSGSCVTDSIYLDWKAPAVDGGRPILGYYVEMYDLPTGHWVSVTQTGEDETRSVLDNILCGIMYRFRVRAFNEIGNSIPGVPSDAFVIDTPGVHIAPYFILCPPALATRPAHDTLQLRAKALGTPKPNILWQKDEDPIFITEGIEITEETDGSTLTVHNLQVEDQGVIQCVAVNHVGKAVASTELHVIVVPHFGSSSSSPGQFTFRAEELVRLKFPLQANPPADVQLLRNSAPVPESEGEVSFRDGAVVVRMGSARVDLTGEYTLTADNGHGADQVRFIVDVEVPPDPPGQPEIVDVKPNGQLSLCWEGPEGQEIDHYIVEYYRDQWQLWLRMKTCLDTDTVINDLIPGSKYKFRVMAASIAGISDASAESEEVMIGAAPEDELFDLPRGRHPARRGPGPRRAGGDRSSLDRAVAGPSPAAGRRHVSLDREVYYDSNNVRRDVVALTSDTKPQVEKLGHLSAKYKLSNDEMAKYKTSMSQLCRKMKEVTSHGSRVELAPRGSRVELEATHHLKLEVSHSRLSSSLSHIQNTEGGHIDRPPTSPPSARRLSSDMGECRQSLTDIRDRIGSLQSLLRTSRTLTASKQHLFPVAEPRPLVTPVLPKAHSQPPPVVSATEKRKASRSDSYSQAVDDDDPDYEETHFPYSPELEPGSTSLLCDKPENRQSGRSPLPSSSPLPSLSPLPTATALPSSPPPPTPSSPEMGELRRLGEELLGEAGEEAEDLEEIRPGSAVSLSSLGTSLATLCDSSVTEMVDTEHTAGRQRLVSSSSQGTLVASGDELIDDDDDDDDEEEEE